MYTSLEGNNGYDKKKKQSRVKTSRGAVMRDALGKIQVGLFCCVFFFILFCFVF